MKPDEVEGKVSWWQSWLARRAGASLGLWGEWVALRWLLQCGWDVVVRNWSTQRGEIDLVAYDRTELVFVEVKTRVTGGRTRPEEAVDDRKCDQLELLALSFLRRNELGEIPIRFDLIAIETPDRRKFRLRHYRGFM